MYELRLAEHNSSLHFARSNILILNRSVSARLRMLKSASPGGTCYHYIRQYSISTPV